MLGHECPTREHYTNSPLTYGQTRLRRNVNSSAQNELRYSRTKREIPEEVSCHTIRFGPVASRQMVRASSLPCYDSGRNRKAQGRRTQEQDTHFPPGNDHALF